MRGRDCWPCRRWNGLQYLGLLAAALGLGIFIAVIFPAGLALFLTAFLLVACGLACFFRQ